MLIVDRVEIDRLLEAHDVSSTIEAGFLALSRGEAVVPAPGELVFDAPAGDVHIKYGHVTTSPYYVIKIASGFYENPARGLPSSDGHMLVYDKCTGRLLALLWDRGRLTDLRTAIAGALVARIMAPEGLEAIGIVGTGIQARLQLAQLERVTTCREVVVCGRSEQGLARFVDAPELAGFHMTPTTSIADATARCRLIVTATPTRTPLIHARDLRPGTHITAVGADTPEKQELAIDVFRAADVVVADRVAQCIVRGDCAHAVRAGMVDAADIVELGDVLAGSAAGRTDDEQLTVADLTGVGIQDVQMAIAVYELATGIRTAATV